MLWLSLLIAGALLTAGLSTAHAGTSGIRWNDRLLESVGNEGEIPDGLVTALAQDSRGMLWLGTQGGLLRFDGYRFRRFNNQPDDVRSLSGDFVRSLCVDADDRVWVGTEADGLSLLDPTTGLFTRFSHQRDEQSSLMAGAVQALDCSQRDELWLVADAGVQRLDTSGLRFDPPLHLPTEPDEQRNPEARSLLFDGSGDLWVGSNDGLFRHNREHDGGASAFTGYPQSTGLEITRILVGDANRLWLGTREHGLRWIDRGSGELHAPPHDDLSSLLSNAWVKDLLIGNDGNLWLGLFGGGLALIDAHSGQVLDLQTSDPADRNGLAFDSIGALLIDRQGTLWIGIWGGGLQRHNPGNGAFRSLRYASRRSQHLTDPSVLRILELADGRILVGSTGNGIDVVDRNQGVIDHWGPDPDCADCLSDGVISGLAKTPDGMVWVGTYQGGVHRLDPTNGRFQRYRRDAGLPTLQIEQLFVTRNGDLWVGTQDGLLHYDRRDDHFNPVRDAQGQALRARITDIAEADDGTLWVATNAGLYRLARSDATPQVFRHDPEDPTSLLSDDVPAVLVDRQQQVWVDTAKGFQQFLGDAPGGAFRNVSAELGRAGQGFGGNLLEDDQGRLWSASQVFDPAGGELYRLDRADGFDVGSAWFGSSAKTRDGQLLFGGTSGLVMIDPARFIARANDVGVAFPDVSIDGAMQPPAAAKHGIQIATAQRGFSIGLSTRDLSRAGDAQYQYRLLGDSDRWLDADVGNRFASFNNLWPGNYTLQARLRGLDGSWGAAQQLQIQVLPRYWQTWPFAVLLLLFALLLIAVLLKLSGRRHAARERHLRQLVDERTSELRAAYARAEQASLIDPLSGLGNRRSLFVLMPEELKKLSMPEARSTQPSVRLALLIIDVDDFKTINDRFGHRAGDDVIETIGALIQAQIREDDTAVRWGGEEFLVVAHVENDDGAWLSGERIRSAIAGHHFNFGDGGHIQRTCSVGFACLPFNPDAADVVGWEQVIEIADAALYMAKHDGRNRVYGLRPAGTLPDDFIAQLRRDPQAVANGNLLQRITNETTARSTAPSSIHS